MQKKEKIMKIIKKKIMKILLKSKTFQMNFGNNFFVTETFLFNF